MPLERASWRQTVRTHFVLCTFIGLLVLDAFREPLLKLRDMEGGPPFLESLAGSLVSGLAVATGTWLIHHLLIRGLRQRYFDDPRSKESRRQQRRGTVAGFVFGAMGPVYMLARGLIPILALVFLFLIFGYARKFLRRAAIILRPGNHPSEVDVLHLVFLYGAIVACFTILNAALLSLDGEAFRGFSGVGSHVIETLYFTIVVMTTLGFGDISPATVSAKLVISLEVVIAYLFFALLVGTITRGILPHEAAKESSQEDPPDSR